MPKSNQMYQLVLSVIIGVLSSLGAQEFGWLSMLGLQETLLTNFSGLSWF